TGTAIRLRAPIAMVERREAPRPYVTGAQERLASVPACRLAPRKRPPAHVRSGDPDRRLPALHCFSRAPGGAQTAHRKRRAVAERWLGLFDFVKRKPRAAGRRTPVRRCTASRASFERGVPASTDPAGLPGRNARALGSPADERRLPCLPSSPM